MLYKKQVYSKDSCDEEINLCCPILFMFQVRQLVLRKQKTKFGIINRLS